MIRSLKYSNRVIKKSVSSLSIGDKAWIDLSDPSPGELSKVSKLTGVYAKDMESVLSGTVLPKTVNRNGYSMVVLRALNPKKGYSHFGIFISNKVIVTVHKKKVFAIDDLLELVSGKEGKEFFSNGLVYIFFRITSYVTKRFHSELDKIEDKIDVLEDDILSGKVKEPTKIFDLKQTVMNVRRALITNRDLVDVISGGYSKYVSSKNNSWLSELRIEMGQVVSISEMLRDRLTGAMEMYMGSISNKLNDIMKGFTVIASLLLLPMLISGIWGMNFSKIPFYENPIGFFVPLIIMVVSIILMVSWFKWKKWI
jgi:magnesium transporter